MSYCIQLKSDTGRSKIIKSEDIGDLAIKVIKQWRTWIIMGNLKCSENEANEAEKHISPISLKEQKERVKEIVDKVNQNMSESLKNIEDILIKGLESNLSVDWNKLKDFSIFPEPRPKHPNLIEKPREPQSTDSKYEIQFGFLDKFIKSKREQIIETKKLAFEKDYRNWLEKCKIIEKEYNAKMGECQKEVAEWQERRQSFLVEQKERNEEVEKFEDEYKNKKRKGVVKFFSELLSLSNYPMEFCKEYRFEYNEESGIIILDYRLPSPDDIQNVKAIKFIQVREVVEGVPISESEKNKMYDNILYRIALRTIYELFNADKLGCLSRATLFPMVRARSIPHLT